MARSANSEPDLKSLTVERLVSHLREPHPGGDTPPDAEDSSPYVEEIIRRFEPLLRSAWRRVSPGLEYQDFVQDVFVKLFRGLHGLEDPKAFPGYFRRVTLSVVADHYRKRRPLSKADLLSMEGTVERIDDVLQTSVLIRSYLEHLPTQEREVLYLEFFRELSTNEISNILHLTPGAVRTAKSRALKRLRQLIADEAKALTKYSSDA